MYGGEPFVLPSPVHVLIELFRWCRYCTQFALFVFPSHLYTQTVSAVTTFFLAMCLHPEIQVAAQAELDSVVGNERLPTMADRPSLPYINAIVKEVLAVLSL